MSGTPARIRPEDLVGEEWAEWYRLTPAERFMESMRLWDTWLALGGSLEPEPDTQSPFFDPEEWRANAAHGGQACVFYGAAEFSRDLDLLILAHPDNLGFLRAALADLEAEPIAIPQLDPAHLVKGHAVHFRCRRSDVEGLRIDLMSTYRGGPDFETLWRRRTTIEIAGETVDLLSLEDLVDAKKTQRDKDWPMITRLIERSYFARSTRAPQALVGFWFRELRTPELLIELATAYPEVARQLESVRPALTGAVERDIEKVAQALEEEEREERRKDREYWRPLKVELEQFRRERLNQKL